MLHRIDSSTNHFTAATCLTWLQQHRGLQRSEAQQLLQGLLQAHLMSIVNQYGDGTAVSFDADDTQLAELKLQLVSEAPSAKFGQPLNVHYAW